jgi:hypothetical protein
MKPRVRNARNQRAALLGVLLIAVGVGFVGARILLKSQRHSDVSAAVNLITPLPTVARPLPAFAKQTTLATAQTTLGQSVVLPQTATVAPSDAGPVWMDTLTNQQSGATTTNVAVTFPAQGMIVGYTRPAPSDGSAAHFQAMAQSMPSPSGASEGQVITLPGGVPALAVQENSDDTGTNFGSVIFNMGGAEVRVMGHNDEATLETIARSILSQSGS